MLVAMEFGKVKLTVELFNRLLCLVRVFIPNKRETSRLSGPINQSQSTKLKTQTKNEVSV